MKETLKGKRKIISVLDASSEDLNNSQFQILVKRINNCKANLFKCSTCPVRSVTKCYSKVRNYLQMEAFKKYHNTELYRKNNEIKTKTEVE